MSKQQAPERIAEIREKLASVHFHAAEFLRDLLTTVDALTARLAHLTQEAQDYAEKIADQQDEIARLKHERDVLERALPQDPRDGVDILDRVTNLAAKYHAACRAIDSVAALEATLARTKAQIESHD